jgi:uncharacterized damage-inducible protein DinB
MSTIKQIEMNSFFQELFDYSHHYNTLLIEEFVKNKEKIPEKSQVLFSHVLNAHHIWNSRINGLRNAYTVWQKQPPEHFISIENDNYETTIKILQQSSLEQTIHYTNSQGDRFSNSIRDVLFHVINHSTYHRAQIATDLKFHGMVPLTSDYIFYKRQ